MVESTIADTNPLPYDLRHADGSGTAMVTYPNGDIYEGSFVNGVKDGEGHYKYASGDSYIGHFSCGVKSGLGKLEYAVQSEDAPTTTESGIPHTSVSPYYHGSFEKGVRSGEGTFQYRNGDLYTGKWSEGHRSGTGVYRFVGAVGGNITGEWVGDSLVQGTWNLPNGNHLETKFENNKPLGPAKWYFKNSNTSISGTYTPAQLEEGAAPVMKWIFDPIHVPRSMDVDDHIEASGCGESYRRMEDCIVEADRDWRKCQKEVQTFRQCMKTQTKEKDSLEKNSPS